MTGPALTLSALPDTFALCRFDADASVPTWALAGHFCAVVRTTEELSIVCVQRQIPPGVKSETGWRCVKVHGPLALSMVGVVASLAEPLAQAGISIFVISTYDTDYLLVKEVNLEKTVEVLSEQGHTVLQA